VIRRLYVHNFRCLENFELNLAGQSSVLLIGKNGSGKSTVGLALEILQKIARGENRVNNLVSRGDLARGRSDVPVRFEIEVELAGNRYDYGIALETAENLKELQVGAEGLSVNGTPVFTRETPLLRMARDVAAFPAGGQWIEIDRHLIALPIVHEKSYADSLSVFKQWLARTIVLRPIPALIAGDSSEETLEPNTRVTNFGAWFSGLLAHAPATYSKVAEYLKQVMPDLSEIRNPLIGKEARSLLVGFSAEQGGLVVPFEDLSDGEKCFMICALVLAANEADGPLTCFWDEPDNYLALDEVGHFVLALRKAFQSGGQLIATSHNPEAIRRFSEENTLVLQRRNHLEPTVVRPLSDLKVNGDLVGAMVRGDL
jgi:predicted ATPase